MRLPLSRIAAAVLVSASGAAHAADPALIGATSGFLLGNAYRCSVPADRVVRAGKVIRNTIHTAAQNPGEEEAANAGFAAAFFSSACGRVRREAGPGKSARRDRGFADFSLEGAGFEPRSPVRESRRFEPASVPSCGREGDR